MRLLHRPSTVHLAEPFTSNKGTRSAIRQSLITLSWRGQDGYGTALAAEPGEIAACEPLLSGRSPLVPADLADLMDAAGIRPSVAAGIDMAVHDLVAKSHGLPLWQFLGTTPPVAAVTSLSIGLCSDAELSRRAREYADLPILKLKLVAGEDARRVRILRAAYQGRIWVDGNGSWSPAQAVALSHELHDYDVELLEQPVRPGNLEHLRHVRDESPIPIVADEDCVRVEDVALLRDCVDAINIKLTKCGGIARARQMIALARTHGLRVMLGCKPESSVGVTAMAHLAGLADYLDLDGHLDLVDDPFLGVTVDRGVLRLPPGAGLGVTLSPFFHPEELSV